MIDDSAFTLVSYARCVYWQCAMLKILSDPIMNCMIVCQNKYVLTTLLQYFLFFIFLPNSLQKKKKMGI